LGLTTSFIFNVLAGQVVVFAYARETASAPRGGYRGRVALRVPGFVIAAIWSCCTGVVVLRLLLTIRDGLA
jgi:hypothetical protein